MIVTEFFTVREDGIILNRTYSDQNHYIERDGVLYMEAIDPADAERVYTETQVEIVSFVDQIEDEGPHH